MTLYEIKDAALKIAELWETVYDEETGEIKQDRYKEVEQLQKYIQEALTDKSNNIFKYFRNIDASIKALKEEETRLYKKRKSLENQKQHLRDYVVMNLSQMGIDKIKTDFGTMYTTTNTSVAIDEKLIPKDPIYWSTVTKTEDKFNKEVLKKLISEGANITGVKLTKSTSLVVRD